MTRGRDWLMWPASLAALAVGFFGVFLVFAVLTARGHRGQREIRRELDCMCNLEDLAKHYARTAGTERFDPTLHGSAQVLSWFGPHEREMFEERALLCPSDPDRGIPDDDASRSAYHPADAATLRAARGVGSYAVRDLERFPIDPKSTEKQPILCDRQGNDGRTPHHRGAILIAFADGNCQKWTGEQLGLAPDEEIVVGPDSKSPLLRVFEKP